MPYTSAMTASVFVLPNEAAAAAARHLRKGVKTATE
jgi:hypothetical protein